MLLLLLLCLCLAYLLSYLSFNTGANFYPLLGPYSSIDPKIIDTHMQMMKNRYENQRIADRRNKRENKADMTVTQNCTPLAHPPHFSRISPHTRTCTYYNTVTILKSLIPVNMHHTPSPSTHITYTLFSLQSHWYFLHLLVGQ